MILHWNVSCDVCHRVYRGGNEFICDECSAKGYFHNPFPDGDYGFWKGLWMVINHKPYLQQSENNYEI